MTLNIRKRHVATTAALTAATAVSGSIGTDPQSSWYRSLDLPDWQPPGWVFPIVWTALYGDIAVTSAAVLTELEDASRDEDADDFRRALLLNLALNQGWSWAFFTGHRLGASVVIAALLAASSVDLARRAGQAGRGAGVALVPYAAWCCFATVLTEAIRRRNR
ncbi:tryptophan-rich sensory protein [Raineyella fluvialis]|uniref:Tryptophan-rich sensory protein n=2 Tax=Raineyella fluvialis TaxID=2662261 RepID=A0A5Q2F9Z5_9ACTN|nr:tryptophan-rich sensory protein [Raineyella fluvialis]